MDQLSGQDAMFLYTETGHSPMHVAGVAIYDQSAATGGRIRFKDILAHVEARLHTARSYRQKLVRVPLSLDHPYWVEDPEFDLEFHVRHIALPEPGDWRQLCIQIARLHARGLDLTRPLWEMYVIEGLDNVPGLPSGSYAIMTKIHHCAIDGATGNEITASLHDLEPGAPAPRAETRWKPEPDPSGLELLLRTAFNNVRQPFRLAGVIRDAVPVIARVTQALRSEELRGAGPVPKTRFNDSVSPHRVVEGRSFSLDDIKAIKKSVVGATVNDAVLTICGGALRAYLDEKNELPEDSLIAMAPVNTRTKEEEGTAGNQVSAMLVAIRSDIADPAERLRAVQEASRASKELTNAIGARLMTDITKHIPASLAALGSQAALRSGLMNRMDPLFNCTITNVPGPQDPLYMGEARLVTTFGMGPVLEGMGLILAIFSYCGTLTITATSCRDMMPDPEFFSECLQSSFDELRDAALGADPTPPANRA